MKQRSQWKIGYHGATRSNTQQQFSDECQINENCFVDRNPEIPTAGRASVRLNSKKEEP